MKRRVRDALTFLEGNRRTVDSVVRSRQGGMGLGGITAGMGRQFLYSKNVVNRSRETVILHQNDGTVIVLDA